MAVYFYQPFTKQYHANVVSTVGLFALASAAALVILPFVFAYMTPAFWLKNQVYFEQPKVQFQNEIVAELSVSDSSIANGQPQTLVFGTEQSFNQFYSETVRVPVVKTAEVDVNSDGKPDYLSFSLTFPLTQTETVQAVRLALAFQCQLSGVVKLIMQSLAVYEAATSLPSTGVTFLGDLELVQRELLVPMTGGNIYNYYNTPAINYTTPFTSASVAQSTGTVPDSFVGWSDIVSRYFARNVRTDASVPYTTWAYGAVSSSLREKTFEVKGILNYVVSPVDYKPSVGEVLKWAWIQYLSVFVVVFACLYVVWWFTFTRRILDTTVTVDTSLSRVLGASGATVGATASKLSSNGYVGVSGLAPGVKPPIF